MSSDRIAIAPSILSADFARLGEQVAEAEAAGADRLHVDVMDGHFVPNLTIGPVVVRALRRVSELPLETHLMIEEPDPGFGGQAFIANTLPKIHRVRELVERVRPQCEIHVDGGINSVTAPVVVEAGACVLVAGSAIFEDPGGIDVAIRRLRTSVEAVGGVSERRSGCR